MIYVCMCVHIYIYVYVYIYTCNYMYVDVCMYRQIYVYLKKSNNPTTWLTTIPFKAWSLIELNGRSKRSTPQQASSQAFVAQVLHAPGQMSGLGC